jgi:hypothetical protein
MLNLYKFHTDSNTLPGFGNDEHIVLVLNTGSLTERKELLDRLLATRDGKKRLRNCINNRLKANNGSIFKLVPAPEGLGYSHHSILHVEYPFISMHQLLHELWGEEFFNKQFKKLDSDIVKECNAGNYDFVSLAQIIHFGQIPPGKLPKTAKLLGEMYHKLNSIESNKRLSALPRDEQLAALDGRLNAIKYILSIMQKI